MNKLAFTLGIAYVALCAFAIERSRAVAAESPPFESATPSPLVPSEFIPSAQPPVGAAGWFASVKPFCNTVEVETVLERQRPPAGVEGAGYAAACWALAGKLDRARRVIRSVPSDERHQAAGIVFEVTHPVADAGDDRSAGPIMALVVEFWPNHAMALYHAGMSAYALGEASAARRYLDAFLVHYEGNDGWRSSATAALERLGR